MDEEIKQGFIDFKKIKGVNETTIKEYKKTIRWIERIAKENGINDDPRTWNEREMRAIIDAMNISLNSQKIIQIFVNQLARYCGNKAECYVWANKDRPNARWITPEQLNDAIDSAPDKTLKLILYLGGYYGLRRGEMARISINDIKIGYIIVHGKGHGPDGKIRKVPLIADKDPMIEEYIEYRQREIERHTRTHAHAHPPDTLLVITNSRTIKDMTPDYITGTTAAYFKKIGINASTHSLRREFITSAYKGGADLISIMRVVGHENPTVTQKYIEADQESERKTVILGNKYILGITVQN